MYVCTFGSTGFLFGSVKDNKSMMAEQTSKMPELVLLWSDKLYVISDTNLLNSHSIALHPWICRYSSHGTKVLMCCHRVLSNVTSTSATCSDPQRPCGCALTPPGSLYKYPPKKFMKPQPRSSITQYHMDISLYNFTLSYLVVLVSMYIYIYILLLRIWHDSTPQPFIS